MSRVLVIAYYYPPLVDVGAKRTVRFVSQMNQFGFEPHVLTVRNPDLDFCTAGSESPPGSVELTRVLSLFNTYKFIGKVSSGFHRTLGMLNIFNMRRPLKDLLMIPDPIPGWLPAGYFRARKILNKQSFDLIYTSVGPLGGAILSEVIARKTGLPFIVDARDPISCKIYPGREPDTYKERFLCRYERKLLNFCKFFVTTSETTARKYQNVYPENAHKVKLIYNGFDRVDSTEMTEEDRNKFKIIYIGDYYPYALDTKPFFRALREWLNEERMPSNSVVFWYLGKNEKWLQQVLKEFDLQETIKIVGLKGRNEMFTYLRSADVFYIRNPHSTNIGAKLFDGLSVEIPILSTNTHEEVANLIKRYAKDHVILKDETTSKIKAGLKFLYKVFERKSRIEILPFNQDFIREFNEKKLTRQLCELFKLTVDGNCKT